MHKPNRWILLAALVLVGPVLAEAGELDLEAYIRKSLGQRHWYGIYMGGKKNGYALMEVVPAKADGHEAIDCVLKMHLKVTALGQQQDVRMFQHRVYRRTGEFHRASTRMKSLVSDVEVVAVVKGGKLILTSRTGAVSKSTELAPPKETLHDFLAAERLATPDAKLGDKVTVAFFEPMMQKEIAAVLTLKERKSIIFNGVPTKVAVVSSHMPALGVTSDTYVDERGTTLEMSVGQLMVLRLEPEKLAKDIRFSADLIRMGCVKLDPHPPRVARLRQIRLQFSGIDDPALVINDGRQQWSEGKEGGRIVACRVAPIDPGRVAKLPVDRARFAKDLAATVYVQSEDEGIKKLAAQIVGDERNAYAAARRINRWVHRNLRKVGTAALSNALETLKSRQGDCTEHTVLFVALARAAGIPAREVAGVTAVDGGEGLYYHAWPEVWVGEWVAMDPTFGHDLADATHIKFAVGGVDKLTRIVAIFGRIKAKVLDSATK